MCVCNAYIEFRNVLYNNIYNVYHNFYNMTDKDKFVYLMEIHWKEVSVYLEKAWEKRTDILYKQTYIIMLNVPGWLTMTRNEYMY